MASQEKQGGSTRGGTPEQHAEAGRQSHKNDDSKSGGKQQGGSTRGATPEQHAGSGKQGQKNEDSQSGSKQQGGSGQSHKNDK